MIVWRVNRLPDDGKQAVDIRCGCCNHQIRFEDDYCEIVFEGDERVRRKPKIRCAACGAKMEEDNRTVLEERRIAALKEDADERQAIADSE